MTREDKLRALCRISQLLADRSLAPIAAAQAKVDRTNATLDQITQHGNDLRQQTDDPVLCAMMARQSVRLQHAKSVLYQALARDQAAVEQAKAKARPDVGRNHVLEKMLQQHQKAQRKKPLP